MSNETTDDLVTIPKRWVDEVLVALASATSISDRSMQINKPEGLNTLNHTRLILEAHINGWSYYGKTNVNV